MHTRNNAYPSCFKQHTYQSINGQKPMLVLYSSANVCSSFVNSRAYLQKMFSACLKLCAGKTVKSLETHTFSR